MRLVSQDAVGHVVYVHACAVFCDECALLQGSNVLSSRVKICNCLWHDVRVKQWLLLSVWLLLQMLQLLLLLQVL